MNEIDLTVLDLQQQQQCILGDFQSWNVENVNNGAQELLAGSHRLMALYWNTELC